MIATPQQVDWFVNFILKLRVFSRRKMYDKNQHSCTLSLNSSTSSVLLKAIFDAISHENYTVTASVYIVMSDFLIYPIVSEHHDGSLMILCLVLLCLPLFPHSCLFCCRFYSLPRHGSCPRRS